MYEYIYFQENAYNKLIRPWGRTLNGTVNFNDSKLTVKLGMRLSQILAVVSSFIAHFILNNVSSIMEKTKVCLKHTRVRLLELITTGVI